MQSVENAALLCKTCSSFNLNWFSVQNMRPKKWLENYR